MSPKTVPPTGVANWATSTLKTPGSLLGCGCPWVLDGSPLIHHSTLSVRCVTFQFTHSRFLLSAMNIEH